MSSDPSNTVGGRANRLEEAVDFALSRGLLKYTAQGLLQHAPFTLHPAPLSTRLHTRMEQLSTAFNALAHRVALARDFLHDTLDPIARVDPFTGKLLELEREHPDTHPLWLGITRSDYFVHAPHGGETASTHPTEAAPGLRQVELNTISASYAGLSALVAGLHAHLALGEPGASPPWPNAPLNTIAEALAQAHGLYGVPGAVMLMVVQPGETNRIDQRLVEFALAARGIRTVRAPLEHIAAEGRLQAGHLWLGGDCCAITYFRAGYGPEDYHHPDAWRARALIAASSTIAVPTLATQLAGAKKVQQVLTAPTVLARFAEADDAQAMAEVFAGQHALGEELPDEGGRTALEVALDAPGNWVLKPQREGGGHNFFDADMQTKLRDMAPEEHAAFILMERIHPPAHETVLVREGTMQPARAVSEVGRFGAFLAQDGTVLRNEDAGYLVRTKPVGVTEGGVSAGFGYLDSLAPSE